MDTLGFDNRSKNLTLRDLDVELEKLDAMVRPVWETITKEFGIQEIAVIADEVLEGIPVLVIPWKGKTDEDYQNSFRMVERAR